MNTTLLPRGAGGYDAVLILTDWEPDDALALLMWFSCSRATQQRGAAEATTAHVDAPRSQRTAMIVGEGNADKVVMARCALRSMLGERASRDIHIVQGAHSPRRYPADALLAFGAAGVGDDRPPPDGGELSGGEFATQFLCAAEHPLVLCLKPSPELFVHVPVGVRAKCTVALYGSFNLRALAERGIDVAHALNNHFERVVLYESFLATGAANSVNAHNAAPIADALEDLARRGDSAAIGVLRLTAEWNAHVLAASAEKAAACAGELRDVVLHSAVAHDEGELRRCERLIEGVQRSVKIAQSVLRAVGKWCSPTLRSWRAC